MTDKDEELSVRRQCSLLSLHRSTAYYEPMATPEEDLALMRILDEEYMLHPYKGSRLMREWLWQKGHEVNRKRVQRLMRVMGIAGINPKRATSKPHPGHKRYPYLLRNLVVTRANQVWASDITYIPMARGFVYVVAIIDWYSRLVIAWRLSNTLDTDFCVAALTEAIERYGTPEIFNTDQGTQFTSEVFTGVLQQHDIQISMDGKGAWRDNVFVERLWRSLKYEEVYLHAYDDVPEARRRIGNYFGEFNDERPHQALAYCVPSQVYFHSIGQAHGIQIAA